jgi:hypothetical protein
MTLGRCQSVVARAVAGLLGLTARRMRYFQIAPF